MGIILLIGKVGNTNRVTQAWVSLTRAHKELFLNEALRRKAALIIYLSVKGRSCQSTKYSYRHMQAEVRGDNSGC